MHKTRNYKTLKLKRFLEFLYTHSDAQLSTTEPTRIDASMPQCTNHVPRRPWFCTLGEANANLTLRCPRPNATVPFSWYHDLLKLSIHIAMATNSRRDTQNVSLIFLLFWDSNFSNIPNNYWGMLTFLIPILLLWKNKVKDFNVLQ